MWRTHKMKRKSLVAILLALVLCFTMALTACKDDNDAPPVGGGKTPPTADQWADAGISGTFTADVKGNLALSVVDNGEISMKWTGSDEASLDNTITWLKGQGFTSYGGQTAEKITEEGGKIKSYTAEKTVNGVNSVSASADGGYSVVPISFTLTASENENKTMIAETFYITEDFSIMGQSFKAGELYLDIYEATTPGSASSLLTAWPSGQIQGAIGENIPAYTGTASGYQFVNGSIGSVKNVQVNVFGAGEADATSYKNLLAQNGYVLNDGVYEKTLTSGDKIQIMAFASQSYHPDTFQITDVINITVMLEKNSGAYTAWNSLDLSVFSGAGIPAYSGGTSFDLNDIGAETIKSEKAAIEQAIAVMAAFESMLGEEQKAELAALRAQLPYFDEIECYMITVYGTNSDQADAYETALANAGFSFGVKKTADYELEVDVSEDEGKATITITRMPIELLDDSSGSGSGTPTESTLPTNLKIEYNDSIYDITAIKIGDDYYIKRSMSGLNEYIYYKKSGAGWDVYEKGMMQNEWQLDDDQETYRNWIENDVFDFIVDGVEGSKTGTETLLGRNVDVYVDDMSSANYTYIYTYYQDTATGLVLKYVMTTPAGTVTYVVTSIDTTVTSFGDVELPQ